MIEAIRNIGEYTTKGKLSRDAFLYGICKAVPAERPSKKDNTIIIKQYVAIFNFNTSRNKIEIKLDPVMIDSDKKYLFIGNTIRHKLYCAATSGNIDRTITTTIPELKNFLVSKVEEEIKVIFDGFFKALEANKQQGHDDKKKAAKIAYLIRPEKFDLFDKNLKDIKKRAKNILNKIEPITSKIGLKKDIEITALWKDATGNKYDIGNKKDFKSLKEKIVADCNSLITNTEDQLLKKYVPDKKDAEKKRKEKLKNLRDDILSSIGDNFTKNNMSFCSIAIDSKLVCEMDGYKQMIYDEKIESLFERSSETKYKENYQQDGVCSICGENRSTTSNVLNLGYKFYITDKRGFSSNLDGKFTKNYNICKDCYQYLMIAENFIDEKLKTRIGGFNVYLIPQFMLEVKNIDIDDFSQYLKSANNSIVNIESVKDFQNQLVKYREYENKKNNFIVNYLFYQKSKSEFKVFKLIKDVPPGRLDFIREKEDEIHILVDNSYGQDRRLTIDLNKIWGCIPVKKRDKSGAAKYLNVLDAIFSDKTVDYGFLINQFTNVIRIIKFETEGYNIWAKDSKYNPELTSKTLQMNFILLFFRKLNILGGITMGNTISNIEYQDMLPDEIIKYWNNLEIYSDESKKALFLLGYLIGEIGARQSVKDIKKKPILNKINFQGMGVEKLIRVVGEIPDKLRQNDILQYNEKILSVCHILMEGNLNKWLLSNQENVFYTLSGYSYSNYIGWQRYKKGIEKKFVKLKGEVEKTEKEGKDVGSQKKQLEEARKLFFDEPKDYKEANKILDAIKINEEEEDR